LILISSLDNIKHWHAKASDEDYISKFIFEYLAFITYLMNHMPLDIDVKDKPSDRTVIQCLKRNRDLKIEYLSMISTCVNFQAAPIENEWFEAAAKNSQWLEMKPVSDELRCCWHTIATILNKAHTQQSEIFDNQKWWNCSYPKNHKCKDGNKAIIRGEDDWVNMVEFWYSLRNNLLHGITTPEDHEYAHLIKNAYTTLRPLVEFFLYTLDLKEYNSL